MPGMSDQPIRVWLEPGYDYGRFGAWALDLPGCATWGDDRAAALASVPGAVASFGAWLARHGEREPASGGPDLEIVEEVPTRWVGDEEINPLFGPDRAPLSADGLALGIRRLDAARVDLLELLDRLAVPSTGAPGISRRQRDRTAERPALAVARHVGSAEVWLVGPARPVGALQRPRPGRRPARLSIGDPRLDGRAPAHRRRGRAGAPRQPTAGARNGRRPSRPAGSSSTRSTTSPSSAGSTPPSSRRRSRAGRSGGGGRDPSRGAR